MQLLDEVFCVIKPITMNQTILYIDGENLRHYLKMVIEKEEKDPNSPGLENLDYSGLFDQVLKGIKISSRIFYTARLREYAGSLRKSKQLILGSGSI